MATATLGSSNLTEKKPGVVLADEKIHFLVDVDKYKYHYATEPLPPLTSLKGQF
jgi:hypothetical protein